MCSNWGKAAHNRWLLSQVVRSENRTTSLAVCKRRGLSLVVRQATTHFYTPIFSLFTQLLVMLCALYTGLITSTTNINYLFIISHVGATS
jgi:hypothetical protein